MRNADYRYIDGLLLSWRDYVRGQKFAGLGYGNIWHSGEQTFYETPQIVKELDYLVAELRSERPALHQLVVLVYLEGVSLSDSRLCKARQKYHKERMREAWRLLFERLHPDECIANFLRKGNAV